ncbi:putative transposase Ptta/En/Spm plant [Arabidopsis thaliana x Arabidopsis arenosa]|uniref:Putative transposase Ptta/En/Spm plant n=1 Tax=Arabidopsis thaliana x Arabidopsis arenosa TaxID=1240361 RepID=A0A8T1Z093_9BRAS|nr:putative transposase Ptta/En/Spm plant [Arabidopsis thaliana x Arabidopsis arenosa]
MRPPITIGGRFYGQGSSYQAADSERPLSQTANAESSEQKEEIAPVQYDIRVLHPSRRNGAKWFKNNTEVSTHVRKIIEGCFQGPWYSWRKVPKFYRDAWFTTFKTRFEWDASIEQLVKANFDALAAARLKGMVSLAKSKRKQPDWILAKYWRVMVAYWKIPKAKEKSEKARSSRLNSRDGLGPHCHRAGSRSYAKVQDVLEANNEDSSFIAVMRATHQKSDGTYVDERARLIAEQYDECLLERLTQADSSNGEVLTMDSLSKEEKNEIYVKIAGISKQGRVFGLGSLQSGVSMSDGSLVPPQATVEVGALTLRVKELETELQKSREDNVLVRLEAVEQLIQTLARQNGLDASSPPPPPVGSSSSPQAPWGFLHFLVLRNMA